MVAAATTSLPETPGGERNWDYRYTWIRDSTFMLWGLYTLGFDWEANDFFYFIADVAAKADDELQIMYGIGGERELTEETLDHLDGYEDARPVRDRQRRLRPAAARRLGRAARLDLPAHEVARPAARVDVADPRASRSSTRSPHWREPDRGIWEVRGEPQHFTSSKVMCWVACDRGARLARLREDHERAERWQARGRRDPRRHLRARRRRARRLHASTTTPTRSTPRAC